MPLYKADPNDSTKQTPDVQGSNRFDKAVNPAHCSATKTPSYVLINTLLTTEVGFFFGTSASLSTAGNTTKANYPIMGNDLSAGTKLNIHPTAWSGSAADAGKITFVYKSGLATGGF